MLLRLKSIVKIISSILCIIQVFLIFPYSLFSYNEEVTGNIKSTAFTISKEVASTLNIEQLSFQKSKYEGLLSLFTHGDFAGIPGVIDFFDYKGYYNIVYSADNVITVERYTAEPKFVDRIQIRFLYPKLGDVTTDSKGNYYVVWGQDDESEKGGIATVAVSKYNYQGNLIKTVEYVSKGGKTSTDAMQPFVAGSCYTCITSEGELICSFAKQMYVGHQANGILRIDTDTMEKLSADDGKSELSDTKIDSNFVSHSFDQFIMELDDGGVCIVNKGDAYPRGYETDFYNTQRQNSTSFHFYGSSGDNNVYSWFGGMVEVKNRIYLVASSAKSLSSTAPNEAQNIFIQLISDDTNTIKGATSRSGECSSQWVKDNNILWLTDYEAPYTVANPQVVEIDRDRFAVMWEKVKKASPLVDSTFVQSYYMVFNSNGTVAQDVQTLGGLRLNSHETPEYRDGYIYWTTAGTYTHKTLEYDTYYVNGYGIKDGYTLKINKLCVNDISEPTLEAPEIVNLKSDASGITVTWSKVNGAEKYKLIRIPVTGGIRTTVCTTAKNTFTDSNAPACKYYKYAVVCVDSMGKQLQSPESEYSEEIKCVCFDDIPEKSWYSDAVVFCVENSYFSGTSDRTFSPKTQMTRAMFVQILYALEGSPDVTFKGKFTDVPQNAWYAKAVEWASDFKVTGGVGNGKFAPSNKVSREQLATFLYAYAKNKNYDITAKASVEKFSDAGSVSKWATAGIQWAIAEGFISGLSPTTLAPKNIATRAQTAVIFKAFVTRYVQ